MIKEGKIGVQETIFLVVIALSNRIFFTAPAVVARAVGTGSWYMALISNAVAIAFFSLIVLLLKRFPGKNLLEIFPMVFGRVIGFCVSAVYAISFIVAGGVLIREFVDMLKIYVFPRTPISVLTGSLIVVIMAAAFLGLETIARTAKLVGYALLIGFILILVLAAQHYNPDNLYPLFGYGLDRTIIEGISRSSAFSEIIVVAIFAGSLHGIHHIKKIGYISLVLAGVIVSVTFLCLELVFPYYSFQELTSPLFEIVKIINYGIFIQRLESIFLLLWVVATVISGSTVFYSSVSCFCKTFRLQDARPVVIPLAILMYAVVMIPTDLIDVVEIYIEALRIYPIFLFYFVPLIALLVSVLRKKKGESRVAPS